LILHAQLREDLVRVGFVQEVIVLVILFEFLVVEVAI
jgi:hypothetical protein